MTPGWRRRPTYRYRVRATDAGRQPEPLLRRSRPRRRRPAADTTPPTAPTGLAATAVSTRRINLTWAASTDNVGVTGYRVERCQGAGCTNFAQIGDADRHVLQRHRLAASTSYRYRVRAVDASGNLSAYSSVARPPPAAPPTPRGWSAPGRSVRASARPPPTLRATATPAPSPARPGRRRAATAAR